MADLEVKNLNTEAVKSERKGVMEVYIDDSLNFLTRSYTYSKDEVIENKSAIGIAVNNNILMVKIENYDSTPKNISTLFNMLEYYKVNACMISQNNTRNDKNNILFLLPINNEKLLDIALEKIVINFPQMKILKKRDIVKVSLIGIGMGSNSGTTAKIFKILSDKNLKFHHSTISEISISLVIDGKDRDSYIKKLVESF